MGTTLKSVCPRYIHKWYGLSSEDGPGEEGWGRWEVGSEPIWASSIGILCTWSVF